ncbi:MAG: DEAD/DEAH box helicase family protein [Bacteroidota bacterium]|nr:DEAD/DEAH box helicase family protein [Bacteroidota bacterium]
MYNSFDLEKLRNDNPRYSSKPPFEHQRDAFEKLSELFTFENDEHKSGILVLPTGAGKTFTSVRWISRNVLSKNVKVLWLAHTGHLLEQAYDEFKKNLFEIPPSRKTINIRVVSSDALHSKASDIQLTDDVLIITTPTAISNTDTKALDGEGKVRKTAFEKFIEHSKNTRLFVVIDEAHHAPAYGCRNLLIGGSKFEKGIRQLVPNSYFLGLTATPTYNDERRRGWLWEIFKNKKIYEVDKGKLIKENILAVPNPIQRETGKEIDVDDILYDTLIRQHKDLPEYLIERLALDSGRNDYIVDDYLANYKQYGKTIIFADRWFQCIYIKEKLIQKAKEKGIDLRAEAVYTHVDAAAGTADERNKRTSAENAKILHDFKDDKFDVLLNVRMLSEGTDVPDINTVFITRQTTSSILLTQMIGRALRGKRAGGGENKETANIVFFVDNWKKVINFATPEEGEMEEHQPLTRGRNPMEFISISLVEDLSRQIDSGIIFSNQTYLDSLPIGWFETEVLVTVGDETNFYKEFVVVFEKTKNKFDEYIKSIQSNLSPKWEDDELDEAFTQSEVQIWMEKFFDKEDNIKKTLDLDLIKIARHYAQTKRVPAFCSFDERNKHNLSQIAEDLLPLNEFHVQEKLYDIYNDGSYMWQTFYKSYDRFKTAFDSQRNRIFHIKKFGTEPNLKIEETIKTIEQRELTEEEKKLVFQRDNYTCLCCGKTKAPGRKVKFQVDHIIPFKFGGETSMNNSQTLCSICNSIKNVNEINFRVYQTLLKAPKENLSLDYWTSSEYIGEVVTRTINTFYHCHAVCELKWDDRPNSKYRYVWEIILFEGNNPEWLRKQKEKLITFIRADLGYPELKDLIIK